MRYAIALMALLCAPAVWAQNELVLGGLSYHFSGHSRPDDEVVPDEQRQRERNPGIGLEKKLPKDRFVGIGGYINTHDHTSIYVMYGYRPIRLNGNISIGLVVGAATGYPDQSSLPFGTMLIPPVPIVSFEDKKSRLGVNLIIAPKPPLDERAVIILQLKYLI